ncbi:MAG TPA: T9SS type B sorting domain-containing protein, partial [Bacteroidia bacterium]|nr:T9SS type B sorting domain-containing protein [Bacteroidia bacterium]
PFTYDWQPLGGNAGTATGLCAGTYLCTVTDSTGCASTYTTTILSPQPLIVSPAANVTICEGQSTTLGAAVSGGTPPYSYAWSNNLPNAPSNTITPLQTTSYTLMVTDANGCASNEQQTLVKVNPSPVSDFSPTSGACPPAEIFFTNLTDSAVAYHWIFGDPSSGTNDTSSLMNPSHVFNAGGNYTITLITTNVYGCTDTLVRTDGASLLQEPHAGVSSGAQFITTLDPVSAFDNLSSGGTSFFIDFGDGDSLFTTSYGPYMHTYDSIGIYNVMLVAWSADGCTDTAWVPLELQEATTLFIPNAFTPNGDGTNDIFFAYGINVSDFDLMIFDRWGMLLYETNDMSKGWNGTFKGEKCQEDVYVWKLRYHDNLGNAYEKTGHVSLVR